jgi:tripartite-type tricarboxylate transporter receptor subunit TctC
VTGATRSEALPDLPTLGDFLPGYEASAWYGVAAPRNTPNEIVQKLNKEINAGLADPKIKARLADLGGTVIPGSPADFGRLVADEIEKWGKVVKFSGGLSNSRERAGRAVAVIGPLYVRFTSESDQTLALVAKVPRERKPP